ncbi:MAG: hypothetical protein WBM41_03485 [Arenicellales bacterium]
MKELTLGTLVATGLILLSTQYVNAGDTALTTEEVIQMISGKTVYGTSSRGHRYKMYFGADGSLKNSGGEKGVWEIKDGSVCNTYDKRGFAGCDKVYRKDNGKIYYVVPNGKKGKFRKFKEGDHL